jgi:hypothetical protein
MTADDWNTATDLQSMLRACGTLSDRKLRLFAVACCRRVWHLLSDERSRRAVEVAEEFADGLAGRTERNVASDAALQAEYAAQDDAYAESYHAETESAGSFAAAAAYYASGHSGFFDEVTGYCEAATCREELPVQADILRDIVGNPFHPLQPLSPSLLEWSDGLVVKLAEAAYQHRLLPSGHLDPDRLAVLADALTDAGCTDDWLLEHLRSEGPHVRGCVGVDAALGRR